MMLITILIYGVTPFNPHFFSHRGIKANESVAFISWKISVAIKLWNALSMEEQRIMLDARWMILKTEKPLFNNFNEHETESPKNFQFQNS